MNLVQLNKQVSVSDQIVVGDVQEIADSGVELLVCNRPDDEDRGQTPYAKIQQEAERLGMEFNLMAFSSYQISDDNRDRLIELIESGKRIHLYCRSGSRSRRLWISANKIGCGGHNYNPSD